MAPPLERNSRGEFTCDDFPQFLPNLSPAEMFQRGIFGGTYFRDISIHGKHYRDAWKEFTEQGWWEGLDILTEVACDDYVKSRNRYKTSCGQGLDVWVDKGWIKPEFDSHGWVHWYCRFFLGRRCADDKRQVSRWGKCAGEKGRWKRNLIAKCVKKGKGYADEAVSPTVRQLLLHWAYELTEEHFEEYEVMIEGGHKTSFIPQEEMKHVVREKKKEKEGGNEEAEEEEEEEEEAEGDAGGDEEASVEESDAEDEEASDEGDEDYKGDEEEDEEEEEVDADAEKGEQEATREQPSRKRARKS